MFDWIICFFFIFLLFLLFVCFIFDWVINTALEAFLDAQKQQSKWGRGKNFRHSRRWSVKTFPVFPAEEHKKNLFSKSCSSPNFLNVAETLSYIPVCKFWFLMHWCYSRPWSNTAHRCNIYIRWSKQNDTKYHHVTTLKKRRNIDNAYSLCKKCPNMEFFLVRIFYIWTE